MLIYVTIDCVLELVQRFNVGEDCPVFDGLYNFCQVRTSTHCRLGLFGDPCCFAFCVLRKLRY